MNQRKFLIGIGKLLHGRTKFVDQLPGVSGDDAPPHLKDRRLLTAKPRGDVVNSHLWPENISTGEDIHCRIPVLGPGVNRDVRFGDHHDAAHTERVELVEGGVNDGGLAGVRRGNQDLLDNFSFFQQLRVTTV